MMVREHQIFYDLRMMDGGCRQLKDAGQDSLIRRMTPCPACTFRLRKLDTIAITYDDTDRGSNVCGALLVIDRCSKRSRSGIQDVSAPINPGVPPKRIIIRRLLLSAR